MFLLPLTTAASSATKFVYRDLMRTSVPWYNATIYKGIFRGFVSVIALLAAYNFVDTDIDTKSMGILFMTQFIYVTISFYHMYLLASAAAPTVLSAIISCLLLISSLIIGRLAFGEVLSGLQMVGVAMAVVAICFMTIK